MPLLPPARPGLRAARWSALALAAVLAACAAPGPRYSQAPYSPAQPLYFYPQHQQPMAQQERDRYECYRWAAQQTGSDPGMTPLQTRRPQVVDPYAGRDMAVGAVTGATFGGLAASRGHGAEGAAVGLIIGALIGAASDQQRSQALQDSVAYRSAPPADASRFQRAMSACMAGRGYVVG